MTAVQWSRPGVSIVFGYNSSFWVASRVSDPIDGSSTLILDEEGGGSCFITILEDRHTLFRRSPFDVNIDVHDPRKSLQPHNVTSTANDLE
jgi:hypothetical protein